MTGRPDRPSAQPSRDPAADLAEIRPDGTSRVGWWGLVRRRALVSPQRPAFVDERGRRLTWGAFADLAEQVAAGLWERGVRPGHTVSWQLPSTLESALLMAALTRLEVRQNPVIPLLRRAELEVIVAQLQPELLVVPEVWNGFAHGALARELAAEQLDRTGTPMQLLVCDLPSDPIGLPLGDPAALPPVPDDTSGLDEVRWLFYTSGTTGVPKGARHTDTSVLAATNTPVLGSLQGPDDVVGLVYPITHIGGPGMIGATLRRGGSTMCIERWDPARTPYDLAREKATVLGSAPPFFAAYLAAQQAHGEARLFPETTMVSNGGAPLSPTMRDRLLVKVAATGVFNSYGLTEFPMLSIAPRAHGRRPAGHPGNAGLPTQGVTVRIVDLTTDRDALPGAEGEIRLQGPQAFQGYVDEQHDAAAFDEQGFVRTGDLGWLEPDGSLVVSGRLKEVIIRNAENISAVEVEGALQAHPAVADAAVIGIPDERTGERCCAFVVLTPGVTTLTLEEVGVHFAERQIARYKTPERLEIVTSLPRNAMGKVLKQQLRNAVVGA